MYVEPLSYQFVLTLKYRVEVFVLTPLTKFPESAHVWTWQKKRLGLHESLSSAMDRASDQYTKGHVLGFRLSLTVFLSFSLTLVTIRRGHTFSMLSLYLDCYLFIFPLVICSFPPKTTTATLSRAKCVPYYIEVPGGIEAAPLASTLIVTTLIWTVNMVENIKQEGWYDWHLESLNIH